MTRAQSVSVASKDPASERSRRDRILTSAVEQFAEKGFAAVRIDEVAAAAGANKQLIYYYFDNKAGLYEASLAHMVEAMAPVWAAVEDAPSLQAAIDLLQVRSPVTTTWARLLAWEGVELAGREGVIHLEAARTASLGHLTSVVMGAKERGEVASDVDAATLALFLITTANAHIVFPQVTKMITASDPNGDEFAARQASLLKVILTSLRA
jgi:TetR/AcrR family transcriptional regulator